MELNLAVSKKAECPSDKKGFTVEGIRIDCTLGVSTSGNEYVLVDTPFIHTIMNVRKSTQDGTYLVSDNTPKIDIAKLQVLLDADYAKNGKVDASKCVRGASNWIPTFGKGKLGYLGAFVRAWVNDIKGTSVSKSKGLSADKPKGKK